MPWVTDPDGQTSHYERPKNRPAKPKKGSLAELAAQFNDDQNGAATGEGMPESPVELSAIADGTDNTGAVESFGAKMARLKREKAARLQDEADGNAVAEAESAYEAVARAEAES